MLRSRSLVAAAVVGSLLLLALSYWLRSWGGVALVVMGAVVAAWYRAQVARSEDGQQFFGDLGEETRLTSIEASAPSELPLQHPDATADPRPPAGRE